MCCMWYSLTSPSSALNPKDCRFKPICVPRFSKSLGFYSLDPSFEIQLVQTFRLEHVVQNIGVQLDTLWLKMSKLTNNPSTNNSAPAISGRIKVLLSKFIGAFLKVKRLDWDGISSFQFVHGFISIHIAIHSSSCFPFIVESPFLFYFLKSSSNPHLNMSQ